MSTGIAMRSYEDVLLAKDKEGKEYYVGVYHDDDGCDWVQDECPVGHLITWHRNYKIGEKHSYKEPADFWQDIIIKKFHPCYISTPEGRQLSREYSQLLLDYTYSRIVTREDVLEAYTDYNPDWVEDSPYFVCACSKDGEIRYEFPVSTDKIEDMTDDDLESMWCVLEKISDQELISIVDHIDDICYFPVFMYEHGGIALSVSNSGYPFNDPWDSGCIGFWYITKEEAKKEYWYEDKWKLSFLKCVKDYIEEFNEIESGNTWGFAYAPKDVVDSRIGHFKKHRTYWSSLFRDEILDNQIDACWGFIGDYDDLVEEYCRDEQLEIIGVVED